MNVIFLNHKIHNCGVYQYGLRLYNILYKSNDITYIYKEIDSYDEYKNFIFDNSKNLIKIIFNYHSCTMPWLNSENIYKHNKIKNIGIIHESRGHFFDIICDIVPNQDETPKKFSIPRPIYENIDNIIFNKDNLISEEVNSFINAYTNDNIPIFGSFGFGFDNKGFDKIITLINNNYERAIIKLIIPIAHFDPNNKEQTINNIRNKLINIHKKKEIILMISHTFFSNENILRFLKSNTMNIFLYDYMNGRSISSVIDYALSVKKPLGISDSCMFRNIYHDSICLYKTSIKDCLENSVNYCEKFLIEYSHENLIKKFDSVIKG